MSLNSVTNRYLLLIKLVHYFEVLCIIFQIYFVNIVYKGICFERAYINTPYQAF